MFDAFAITLREVAELILIVGSLAAYLRQAGRGDLIACIGWGLAVGLGARVGARGGADRR